MKTEEEVDYRRMYLKSQIAFNIEMNAKNEAYFFILSNGLYNQFADFCKNYHSSNPHKDCVNSIVQIADIKERLTDNN